MPKGYNKKSKKRLKELIQKLIKELQKEDDLEEITTTGDVEGYNTPKAFSKNDDEKKKRLKKHFQKGGSLEGSEFAKVKVKHFKKF